MIDWKKLTSNQFEKLALTYAEFKYSEYTWEITKEKSDDNHDFYYIEVDNNGFEWEGWGEAKHSGSIKKIMSREKWDQTIVSGFLAKNVKHLMFVTNAQIPIKYILRAECIKAPPYEKFEYINNNILEDWLQKNPQYLPAELKESLKKQEIKVPDKLTVKFYVIDYFSVSSSRLHNISEVSANKDYLLITIIDSNYNTQLKVKLNPSEMINILPYGDETILSINVPIGITCIKSIIRFSECDFLTLRLSATDIKSKKKYRHSKKYKVYNNFCPRIFHSNQLKITEQLSDELKKNESHNSLQVLYAPKGAGKTYLLNMFLREYNLYNQIMFFTFTEDLAVCARNLCSLFLGINFGANYDNKKYWNNICCLYENIPDDKKTLLLPELKKIYEGSQKDNSADSILAIKYIEKHIYEIGISLLETGIQKYVIIIIDDVHKIPEKFENLFCLFIKLFYATESYGKLILSGREHEFSSKSIHSLINGIANKTYRLFAPKIKERQQTLIYNFPFIKNCDYFSGILKKCNSTMLLGILMRKIKQFVDTEEEKEAKLQIKISRLYVEICSNTNSIDVEEFLFYSKDFDIIFPIYAYQSGLNIGFFKSVNINNDNILKRIYNLINAGIIDIQGDYLVPSHDVFQNVFKQLCNESRFETVKEKTADIFCREIDNSYIDKHKVLSILLELSEKHKYRFLEESKKMLVQYYKNTEYGKINLLCEKIVSIKYPDIENSVWDKEKLWLLYLYADCLDHCGSLQKSKEYFELVYENGLMVMEDDSIDFIWDAKAQIFNINYYLLNVKGLIKEIDNFLNDNCHKINNNHTLLFEIAYLNSLNRRMMVSFLLDKTEDIDYFSKSYYDMSVDLNNKNHQAYYYIDFARGIYNTNPYKALEYLRTAFEFFKKIPSEKRRLIDTESEICFLECIIEGELINRLEDVSERIHQNGYTHMYVNTLLKRAAVRIYLNDLHIAKNLLMKISLIFDIEKYPRTQLLFSNLMGAISFLEEDDDMVQEYNNMQNLLATNIGDSYKTILASTAFQNRKIRFNYMVSDDCYPIETRLW